MKIIIEIGPNRITKGLSRIRNALKEGRKGFMKGWKEFSRQPAKAVEDSKSLAA